MKSCTILQATTPYPFVTKDIIKHMHNFLVVEQKVFLGMKEHLKETIVEKLQKEVEHWRAQLMFDDWRAIHAQVRADFDKVKDALHIVELFLQEISKSLTELSIDGVLVECVDSDEKKDQIGKVLNL